MPSSAHQLFESALAKHRSGQLDTARDLYLQALKLEPAHADCVNMLATVLSENGDTQAALPWFEKAIELNPNNPLAHNNLGTALFKLKRHAAALASFDQAIVLNPTYADALYNRSIVLRKLGRNTEALAQSEKLPTFTTSEQGITCLARAAGLLIAGKFGESLQDYQEAIDLFSEAMKQATLSPEHVPAIQTARIRGHLAAAHVGKGNVWMTLGAHENALPEFLQAVDLAPDYPWVKGMIRYSQAHLVLWSSEPFDDAHVADAIGQGKSAALPFTLLSMVDDPSIHKRAAEMYTNILPSPTPQGITPRPLQAETSRIRLAYLSADFRHHAVMRSIAQVFELHDRASFELFAYDYGYYPPDRMSARLKLAFEHYVNAKDWTDEVVAQHMRDNQIDILIDLMGYTSGARVGIIRLHPAPVCVNYLGNPATLGSASYDYIIGDPELIPHGFEPFYTEQVVRLPDCYMPSDGTRQLPLHAATRESLGLPPDALVLCCFSTTYKIKPEIFDIWMRILQQLPASVLWLVGPDTPTRQRLQQEARNRGVNPDRLVFTERASYAEYLANYQHADMFLDTIPYNALATACDALWCGVPVVTMRGRAYVSRGAASMLKTAGLQTLITDTLQEYEERILWLARQPEKRRQIREQLLAARDHNSPLFDMPRYTRHLERAFQHMHQRASLGQPAASFDVALLSSDELDKVHMHAQQHNTVSQNAENLRKADQLFDQGLVFHRANQVKDALALYRQALLAFPNHPDSISMMAAGLLQQKQLHEARQWSDKALALCPKDAVVVHNHGSILAALHLHAEALSMYDKAIMLKPDYADAIGNRTRLLQAMGSASACPTAV